MSRDSPWTHIAWSQALDLEIPLLSDFNADAVHAFGIAFEYRGLKDVVFGDLPPGWKGPFVVGTIAAIGAGLLAITALLDYVRRHSYTPFVIYRLVVAAIIVLLIATGVREATF